MEEFEKAGLLKITKKIIKNDCIYIEGIWEYGHTPIKKTLFPDSWSHEKIIESLLEVANNPSFIKKDTTTPLIGKTYQGLSNGIELEVHLKKNHMALPWEFATGYVSKKYIIGS